MGVAIGAGSGSFLLAVADHRFHVFALGTVVALRARWLDVTVLAFGLTYVLGRVVVPRLIDALI